MWLYTSGSRSILVGGDVISGVLCTKSCLLVSIQRRTGFAGFTETESRAWSGAQYPASFETAKSVGMEYIAIEMSRTY